jgi:hypothetical protein
VRCLAVEVERTGDDGVGISGNHVDTGDLLRGLDEETEENTTEGLSLSTFQEFPVLEWGSSLLRFKGCFDGFQVFNDIGIVHGSVGETRENVVGFVHASFLHEPTGRFREEENEDEDDKSGSTLKCNDGSPLSGIVAVEEKSEPDPLSAG